jgi:hypothetical protein
MPLHDWTDRDNFDGLHLLWIAEITALLRHTLPPPFRVVVGSSPVVSLGPERVNPDVAVTNGRPTGAAANAGVWREPDSEVAVTTVVEEDITVQVERNGRLVAAVELISPGNKDRPENRDRYAGRYLNYLHHGVHLLIVDVHRRPVGFSFPQRIADVLATPLPAPPAPSAVVYRVGEPVPDGGRLLAVWAEPLTVGQPLPAVSLPLTVHLSVPIDLEGTYARAAENCYLE